MLKWVTPMMWQYCRIVGNVMTFVGLSGLLCFAGYGLVWMTNKMCEEE